jgi:hypothetical protein
VFDEVPVLGDIIDDPDPQGTFDALNASTFILFFLHPRF